MRDMVKLDRNGKPEICWAKNFEEACKRGYFFGSISFDDFKYRLTRYNDRLRILGNSEYMGLFDGANFICGVTKCRTVPKFTIMRYDSGMDKTLNHSNQFGEITHKEVLNDDDLKDKVLARGWEVVFKLVEKFGYKVDRKGL